MESQQKPGKVIFHRLAPGPPFLNAKAQGEDGTERTDETDKESGSAEEIGSDRQTPVPLRNQDMTG